ncbi:MAG TPA: hypothetical protein VMW72_08515 [Sedimentisphaerales bacterium]|nr:hypothetical protein [Sedimentisphaerales bacterium]
MLKFGIEFYDDSHKERLKANCERYEQMEKLVVSGFEVEAEELFSYSMFVEQLLTENGWQSYRDLQTALPPFRQTWERHFNCSALTVYAKRETSLIHKHYKEALGVGGALSVVSNVYDKRGQDVSDISGFRAMVSPDIVGCRQYTSSLYRQPLPCRTCCPGRSRAYRRWSG